MALLSDGDIDALLADGLDDRLAADVSRFGAEANGHDRSDMTVRWECEGGARPIPDTTTRPDKRGNGRAWPRWSEKKTPRGVTVGVITGRERA